MTLTEEQREYHRVWQRAWRDKNRKRLRPYFAEKAREWRLKNPIKAREIDRKKREKHKVRIALYEKNRPRRKSDPFKVMARTILNNAVRTGRVKKPIKCQKCPARKRIQAHHHDYAKPIEVLWLCHKCHVLEHHPLPVAALESVANKLKEI